MRRVVVTGIGMLSPLANTAEKTWQNLLLGKSGIVNIEHFDTSDYSTKFAGLVKDFDAQIYMERKEAKKNGPFHSIRYCCRCSSF
jgi:3-oxoacyl-[acyl-carrier-protein] synthase II